jgi:hypothetical protein
MNMCLILNGYRDRALGIYKQKGIVNGNIERNITDRQLYLIYIQC